MSTSEGSEPSLDREVPSNASWELEPPSSPGVTDERLLDGNRAILARPTFSMRSRLILAFSLIFGLCGVITFWSIFALSQIQTKIHFLESAASYMSEIQQARRFEKNYLLYGTNLTDALEHLNVAETLIRESRETIERIQGPAEYRTMRVHLSKYHSLLTRLGATQGKEARASIETALREHGSLMVSFAMAFVEKERQSMEQMIFWARRVPFVFLALLLLLMVFIASFLVRQFLDAMTRFTDYTRRIGQGDFTPITPRRKYRDEFSQLAIAFNQMIRELDRRQLILMESHKLRAIGTLVAGVAHELNNPLNNVMLTSAVLQEDFAGLSDEERLEMVEDIIRETERSRKIVRNLLDFARDSKTSIQPLHLDRILTDSIALVSNQVKLAGVRLVTQIASDLPPVHGDEQMLQQVFVNLMLNAIDAMPNKGMLKVTLEAADDGFVAVEFQDTGTGMPEHILSRIFDPFFTTKVKGKGTGLGLSVSQGIVRKLGGYIRVRSKVGEGTSFRVFLPITHVPASRICEENMTGSAI